MKLIPIEGNTNYYVTRYGDVLTDKYGGFQIRKKQESNGYESLNLSIKGIKKRFYIHRLLATTFIDNPENKMEVNHLNGIKSDNNIENLDWCTGEENMAHAFSNNLSWMGKDHPRSKQVGQYTKEGVLIKIWGSIGEASRSGFSRSVISRCINGLSKNYASYTWKEHKA